MKTLLSLLALSSSLFAANAPPTAITSMTVSGSTVTVNSAAHGLVANQGFCIVGSSVTADNVCEVVASVTANSYTFSMAGLSACASSCGTAAPAPRVIVLAQSEPDQGHVVVSYLLWLTTQQPCAAAGANSGWTKSNGSNGATAAQIAAIGVGNFIEVARTQSFPANAATGDITTFLQNDYALSQQALASNIQPCQYYGQVFDGTGWAKQ